MLQFKRSGAAWLVLGVVVGLVAASLLPSAPMHAMGTDRVEGLAITTTFVDSDLEGVFVLDFLTGQLNGLVLNPTNGQFAGAYQKNITADLKVDPTKNPKYTLIAGNAAVRGGAGVQSFAQSVLYIAEATTGNLAAYAIPFNRAALNSGRAQTQELQLIQMVPFRGTVVR